MQFQSKRIGPQDAFLTHVDPKAPGLLYSTYFGGSGYETVTGIAMDPQGGIYIGGATDSTDLPVDALALARVGACGLSCKEFVIHAAQCK